MTNKIKTVKEASQHRTPTQVDKAIKHLPKGGVRREPHARTEGAATVTHDPVSGKPWGVRAYYGDGPVKEYECPSPDSMP